MTNNSDWEDIKKNISYMKLESVMEIYCAKFLPLLDSCIKDLIKKQRAEYVKELEGLLEQDLFEPDHITATTVKKRINLKIHNLINQYKKG